MSRKFIIIVVFGSIFVLNLGAFVAHIIQVHHVSATAACLNNLRQLDGAKQQWMLENDKRTNEIPTWEDLKVYLGRGAEGSTNGIRCPKGGTYTLGKGGELPLCSIGGPGHTLDYDSTKDAARERRYHTVAGVVALLSAFGFVCAIFLVRKT